MATPMPARASWLLAAVLLCCNQGDDPPSQLPLGTWGGNAAGLIVSGEGVHVHVSCTVGEIPGRVAIDAGGAFEVEGRHNVNAFPVDLGIFHPARYNGRLHGNDRLTLEVTLLDTGQRLGPAQLFHGREPEMGNCPICAR